MAAGGRWGMRFDEWWNENGQRIYDAMHGNKFRDEGARVLWQAAQDNAAPEWRSIETAPKDGPVWIGLWRIDRVYGIGLYRRPTEALVGWMPWPENGDFLIAGADTVLVTAGR